MRLASFACPPPFAISLMKVATMVAVPQTKSMTTATLSESPRPTDCKVKLGPKETERAELMAWNSVGRRIAAVFVDAANEVKAEEVNKMEARKCPYDGDVMSSDCAKAMCSPAPSSVYPTDVSTAAGTEHQTLSEVASDSGNEADYDCLSDFDSDGEEFESPDVIFKRPSKDGFKGMADGFKTPEMDVDCKDESECPSTKQENWRCVGQRLAAVMLTLAQGESDSDEDFPSEQHHQ